MRVMIPQASARRSGMDDSHRRWRQAGEDRAGIRVLQPVRDHFRQHAR